MLVFASHSAFAQVPEPGSPPQISQTITVSSSGNFGGIYQSTDGGDNFAPIASADFVSPIP